MCTKDEHLAIESENREFCSFIRTKRVDPEKFNNWMSVIIFYAAIHHCESWFALIGNHHVSHKQREEKINDYVYRKYNSRETRAMSIKYDTLKGRCNRSRYDGEKPTQSQIDDDLEVLEEFIKLSDKLFARRVSEK